MTENIKARWLTDNEQVKIAPKTLVTQILNEDGTRFKKTFEDSVSNINTAIDETNRTIRDHANNAEIHVTAEEKEAWSNISLEGYATEEYVKSMVKSLNSNLALSFYCIEDVTVITNGVSETFPANSNVELKFLDTDVFEIVPTSDNSILSLNAYPGALGTYYSWLEGVKLFSNILFDMNNEDMYSKWSQGNQGAYQVQFAQYNNCIFWSDNPYISDVARRTNYTLCATTQLPLCYSTIPENTFKSFYLAFSVNSDPNWSNPLYKNSFAQANWATQAFSYYGARVIGYPGHDSSNFNIILPKDCRGLMFDARNIECAGTFDAINCTNFGAKSGSWREAFGECLFLRRLYIKNLKVNLNISWSPIDYASIYFIISKAANTNAIKISVSPYTYNLLGPADFELAASKNITIELLTTNYKEDKRFSTVAYTTGDAEFTGDVIAGGNGGSSPVSLKSVNNLVQSKADANAVLLKTEQSLTDDELTQVRKNLKFIGKDVEGKTFTIDGTEYIASANAEIFGDYTSNIAIGQWSIAEGSGTVAKGRASHAEGAMTQALSDGTHTEGYQTKATGFWSHAEGELTTVSSYASHAEGSYCTLPDGTKRYGTAAGYASHTEGGGCHTTGSCSHAEGLATTASGAQSHVEGRYTIAAGGAQHVEGIANVEDTEGKYIHIAGNGAFDARKNAYTLDWNGNGWYAGDVYVGSASGIDKDEGSKKLATEEVVDAKIANLINSAPETLDTLGELASALNNDKDIINVLNEAITNKVDKEENKGLSSNDYTDDDKENLIKTEALSHKNYITSTFLDVTLVEAYEADIASLFEN